VTPTISIVSPSYQQAPFLEMAMRSVLLQDYPKLEYVVMDGGSTDGSRGIIERYASRLKHFESAKDSGQADAVKRGFDYTSGEIMAYLNSDDLLAPGALAFAAQYFADHPEVDCFYSNRVFIRPDNTVSGYWILPPHSNWAMVRWNYIPQETCFWRRSLYDAAGGIDPTVKSFGIDYGLFVRFMARTKMRHLNRFLGAFREHGESKTSLGGNVQQHPEVVKVRQEHAISLKHWHWVPERILHDWIASRSRRFALSGGSLPGSLPGLDYDYDQVWNGRLKS
jgi:glycosyltransferase involved in cell wall biosynthesis